jgi:hypothetical protein
VAEYLEYRLGDERVPEFERICLDSEIHLAEVASCHQILTLVLGEPAEIDPHSRERMYALAAQADAPPVQTDSMRPAEAARSAASHQVDSVRPPVAPLMGASAGAAASAPVAPVPPEPPVVRRAKPEVPDYLRENRFRWWPLVAMVLVAATLTLGGLYFFGPAPFRQQVTALVATPEAKETANETQTTEQPDPAAAAETAPGGNTAPADNVEPSPAVAAPVDAAGKQADAAAPAEEPQPGTATVEPAPAAGAPATPVANVPLSGAPAAETPAADAPAAAMPATETPPAEAALSRPAGDMPADGDAATAPVPPEPGIPGSGEPRTASRPAAPLPLTRPAAPGGTAMPAEPQPLPGGAPSEPAAGDAAAPDARRLPAEGFGRYTLTAAELLLNFDPASGDWLRLPAQAPLNKGQRLLSLPLFQPTITLSSNFLVQADGPADFELVGWDEAGVPIISVQYGRMLMSTIGKAGNALRLQIDGQEPLLTFVDPESTVAIEVRRDLPPGKNPDAAAAPLNATLYAVSGVIRVAKQEGPPVELAAPALVALVGVADQPPGTSQFPQWVNQEQSKANDLAASEVQSYVAPDKSVALQLRELLDPQNKLYKRREVRTLAVRSLANLGDFEPSVTALNDADLRQYWHEVRRELQAAIARNPETAQRVRAAFIKQRGETDGKALYRMLWGYSPNDLQTGSDRDLVDALGRDDSLDFRVLGILALEELNGGASHGFRPDDTPFKRKPSLTNWKGRIGKMVPRSGGAGAKSRPTATTGE